jgi:hypothetical protein
VTGLFEFIARNHSRMASGDLWSKVVFIIDILDIGDNVSPAIASALIDQGS